MFALHPGAWAPGGIDAAKRSSEGRSPFPTAVTILEMASRKKPLQREAKSLRGKIAWRADGSLEDAEGR